jgi:hypothetical protein
MENNQVVLNSPLRKSITRQPNSPKSSRNIQDKKPFVTTDDK